MVLHREARPSIDRSRSWRVMATTSCRPTRSRERRVDGHEVDEPFAVVVDLPGGVAGDATVAAVSHEPHAGAIELAMNATMSFSSSGFGEAALHRA
jgi:hypothetical protein